MKFNNHLIAGCVIAAGFFNACGDDSAAPPPPGGTEFKDLTSEDDVLFNLALAHNVRTVSQLDKLLDEDFLFFFSAWDVTQNGTPASWGRAFELSATGDILDPAYPGDARVVALDVRLAYSADGWLEEPPNARHPGESWWTKTATYSYIIQRADNWEFRAVNKLALFKIRWDDDAGQWRLVNWVDDVGSAVRSPGGAAVEDATWGLIKFQYVPGG